MNKFSKLFNLSILAFAFTVTSILNNANAAFAKVVETGDKVAVRYVGSLGDGRIFDSNMKKTQPLMFVVGSGKVLPDFEKAVLGLNKGEKVDIDIAAAAAYGEFDAKKIIKIKATQLPANAKPGKKLELRSAKNAIPVRLIKIDSDVAYVDANHVLAGEDLHFNIVVEDIVKQ